MAVDSGARCAAEQATVLIDPAAAERAGIECVAAEPRRIIETLTLNGEVEYDLERFARITSRAAGLIEEVRVSEGDRVEAGQVVAVVESQELGRAKAEWAAAIAESDLRAAACERERALREQHAGSDVRVQEAEAALRLAEVTVTAARERLRALGLADVTEGDISSRLEVRTPVAGTVVLRTAFRGQAVAETDVLVEVADPDHLWARLDAFAADLAKLEVGQWLVLRVDGLPGTTFRGEITWLGASVSERTRTVPVRAALENVSGLLRRGMFGRAEVRVGGEEPVLAVPRDAVQFEGCCHVVFVEQAPGVYQTRKVTMGAAADGYVEIRAGVFEHERVVVAGSFLLKTEILRGSIGAGCCD